MLRYISLTEWVLICPAVVFMTSLFVRNLQPAPYEPAQTARLVVDWFSARPLLGLDLFLIAMPLAALVIGCVTATRRWGADAELRQAALEALGMARAYLATLLIAAATLTAGGILAIVALHMITD